MIYFKSENNLREDFAMLVKQKLDKFKEKNPSLGEVIQNFYFFYFLFFIALRS